MTLGDGERRPELMVFHDTFAFRLRSCDQVTVRLSRSYNGALDDDYEFVLDPRYGNYSELRTVYPTQAVVIADLGGRLSCTDYSDFWIAIGDGMLKVWYIPWNIHTALSRFVLVVLYHQWLLHLIYIFFRAFSLAQNSRVMNSEVMTENMDKIIRCLVIKA